LILMLSSQLRCAIVVSSNLISLEVILNMTTTDGMKIEIGFLSCNLQGCDNLSGRFLFGGKPVSGMLAGLAREPFGVDHYGILLTTLESPSSCHGGVIFSALQDNRSDSPLSHHEYAIGSRRLEQVPSLLSLDFPVLQQDRLQCSSVLARETPGLRARRSRVCLRRASVPSLELRS
jgi:hypothetical protein